jgi:cardiolipin synthase A/B
MTIAVGDVLHHIWHIVAVVLGFTLSVLATGHAVLNKRDSRAAIAWVGFVWFVPLVGAVMYFIFGVNRIRRKAALLRRDLERYQSQAASQTEGLPEELQHHLPDHGGHLKMLARVVGEMVARPLLPGNRIDPLVNGDEAYPAMLEAIQHARQTVSFVTYIFDRDEIGMAFARALGDAARRGVEVRVLIDATGSRYSWPTIFRTLRQEGVKYARFLPFALWHLMSMNMHTHRKILVVDGRVGFTGGMNIRVGHCLNRQPHKPVLDIHFRVQGPVVNQLQEVFTDDWLFTTGEALRGDSWFPKNENAGQVLARGVNDGPDENYEKLYWTLLGALSIARYSIRIMTPYFLPDPAVVSALNLAAMRGVQVDIILPSRINVPFVLSASRAMWPQMLQHGCRIWLTPPPFDHSKLMLVDGCWVLLGSSNWDSRSLRLNFEFNVECYDVELVQRLDQLVDTRRDCARRVTLEEIDGRPLPSRLRDGIAHLLTPYL